MQVSLECLETLLESTAVGGELCFVCEGTGVSTGGPRPQLLIFAVYRCVFTRKLGYVLDGQPTVILGRVIPDRKRVEKRGREGEGERERKRNRKSVESLASFGSRCVTSPCHANA